MLSSRLIGWCVGATATAAGAMSEALAPAEAEADAAIVAADDIGQFKRADRWQCPQGARRVSVRALYTMAHAMGDGVMEVAAARRRADCAERKDGTAVLTKLRRKNTSWNIINNAEGNVKNNSIEY